MVQSSICASVWLVKRRRHHEARVAGGVAEVHEAAFRQHDDLLAVREFDVVDLRLDLVPLEVLQARDLDLAESKWPMLQTMALFFIARM